MNVRCAALALLLTITLHAAQPDLKVHIGDRVVSLPLERYVAAVLAGESADERSDEALKAMAVAARTYAVHMRGRHATEGYDLCDATHCQRVNLSAITPRLERAAADTAGEMLWYSGKPAFTPYTRDCGGKTEDAAAVWPDLAAPYLKSHPDAFSTDSRWHWSAEPSQIARIFKDAGLRTPDRLEHVSILNRTPSGRASVLLLSGSGQSVRISASSFRFAIGRALGWNTLPSDAYTVNGFYFEGSGSGHGVGLCQLGAGRMGAAGRSYREILAYYYPGATLGLNASGLAWKHLSGETISLSTLRPDTDPVVLTAAEHLVKVLSARTGWPIPRGIELRVYPDLDAFRNSTGEPGWVAARTDGRRIHLQPVALLRSRGLLDSTLSHELVHVMMEARATSSLPLWFREGLVDYLANPHASGVARIPAEADLRQRDDPAAARRAYADAETMVAREVRTYGEATVLAWVTRGLPSDVTKASTSQAATKSR